MKFGGRDHPVDVAVQFIVLFRYLSLRGIYPVLRGALYDEAISMANNRREYEYQTE